MMFWLIGVVIFLAYTNGANDNFKGVATLFGSRTTDYRRALWWATATTLAGSGAALLLSSHLVKVFSGKGLVPEELTQDPSFLLAVGLGAAVTVMLATLTGWPVPTTHALIGALVGTGLVAAGSVQLSRLGATFFLPLALSPLISLVLTTLLYPLFRSLRRRLGVERQMCLCVGEEVPRAVQIQPDGMAVLRQTGLELTVTELENCQEHYQGRMFGIDAQWMLDRLHFVSAGVVSFARGLNDTPKIVALLMVASVFQVNLATSLLFVGLAMAAGGLLSARRVALTMSRGITAMNHGQAFTANLVTAFLVLVASGWGLPVSTTHVSCGSLFGLGAVTRQGHWSTIQAIALSWFITLPIAAFLAGLVYWLAARGRSTFSELRWYPPMEAAKGSLSWVFRAKQPESVRTGP